MHNAKTRKLRFEASSAQLFQSRTCPLTKSVAAHIRSPWSLKTRVCAQDDTFLFEQTV